MSIKIWIDGEMADKADAKVSVYDHGLLYGDGVFEGIRAYNGRIFEERPTCDASSSLPAASASPVPQSAGELSEIMYGCMEANGLSGGDCYIRLGPSRAARGISAWTRAGRARSRRRSASPTRSPCTRRSSTRAG